MILEKLHIRTGVLSMVYEAVNSYYVFPKIELYVTPQVIAYRIFPLAYCFCVARLQKYEVRMTDVLVFAFCLFFD